MKYINYKLKIYIYLRKIFFIIGKFLSFFIKKGSKDNDEKKILIVRTDNIGDFVIFSPIIKRIREVFYGYKIHLLANKGISPLVNYFKEIDFFIPLDVKKFQLNFFYFLKMFLRFKKTKYDVIIAPVYSRSITLDEIVNIFDCSEKIGFDGDCNNMTASIKKNNNKFYTKLLKLDIPPDKFEGYRYKEFLKFIGYKKDINMDDLLPKINLPDENIKKSINLLKNFGWNGGDYVVIHPGAGLNYRIWPIKNFVEIINFLREKKYEIVISGNKEEKWIISKIKEINPSMSIIDITGYINLFDLLGILKNSTFCFCSETSILHLSIALRIPTVCILGGGHFGRFSLYGDPNINRFVYDKNMKCKNDNWECAKKNLHKPAPCIENISVVQVKKEIDLLLSYLSK